MQAAHPPNPLLFDTINIVYRSPEKMRYDTAADWEYRNVNPDANVRILTIVIPDCDLTRNNPEFVYLLVKHEQTEAELCQYRGVTSKEVDEFDIDYEAARPEDDDSEPGDQPEAPYHWQHTTAETQERLLAAALDVTWGHYMRWVNEVFEEVKSARSPEEE